MQASSVKINLSSSFAFLHSSSCLFAPKHFFCFVFVFSEGKDDKWMEKSFLLISTRREEKATKNIEKRNGNDEARVKSSL